MYTLGCYLRLGSRILCDIHVYWLKSVSIQITNFGTVIKSKYWFVVQIKIDSNDVIVACENQKSDLFRDTCVVVQLNWQVGINWIL
jgi:tRNA U34 2-thiouridine synthase MnmA/TrmU